MINTLEELNDFVKEESGKYTLPVSNRYFISLNPTYSDASDGAFILKDVDELSIKTRGNRSMLQRVGLKLPIEEKAVMFVLNNMYKHSVNAPTTHIYKAGFSLPGLPDKYALPSHNPEFDAEIRFYMNYDE